MIGHYAPLRDGMGQSYLIYACARAIESRALFIGPSYILQ